MVDQWCDIIWDADSEMARLWAKPRRLPTLKEGKKERQDGER